MPLCTYCNTDKPVLLDYADGIVNAFAEDYTEEFSVLDACMTEEEQRAYDIEQAARVEAEKALFRRCWDCVPRHLRYCYNCKDGVDPKHFHCGSCDRCTPHITVIHPDGQEEQKCKSCIADIIEAAQEEISDDEY